MEKVRRMVEERADDVYHFEFNAYKDDVKKVQEMLIESSIHKTRSHTLCR